MERKDIVSPRILLGAGTAERPSPRASAPSGSSATLGRVHRFSFLALLLAACDGGPAAPDAGAPQPIILEALAPSPVLEGSIVEVRGLGLDDLGDAPSLAIHDGSARVASLSSVPDDSDGTLLFAMSADAVSALGEGTHAVEVTVFGAGLESEPFAIELDVATTLPVALSEAPAGEVYRNEVAVVTGAGIVAAGEGELALHFAGTFTPDGGAPDVAIDVSLPVAPLELRDRTRGVVVLTTDLGGLFPGTFDGTVQLRSTLRSGERSDSAAVATTLHFNPPALYGLDTTEASLGRILSVRGAGFLGGSDRSGEATLLRLAGTFTPDGGTAEPFAARELVPFYVSGSEVELELEAAVSGEQLVSTLFGHARGVFEGTATPIAISGTDELEGDAVPFTFTLGPIVQVVHVRFLPGFFDSLARFGLENAASEVIDQVKARIDGIYADYNVDVRLEEPDDFARTAYSVLEIGGPDPTGSGLFGYDNTPGKDVGNLRLFDEIGGSNAETQSDGFPGYGGVFVESFLYWSSHPELPGDRPPSAPDVEPLFDEIFDAVRAQAATRAEVEGSGERAPIVERAVLALGSLIGETAAHELGHSFGMAQPYGPPTVYHNDFDAEGCIMDSGGDRPFGERVEEAGFTETQFCYDEPSYLSAILGP
jgi:hypothetical protein